MRDVECPYCGKEQEIDHDDGYGYDEDELYQQECINCEKVFGFYTYISLSYEVEKVPCFNGSSCEMVERRYKLNIGNFSEQIIRQCKYCDKTEYSYTKKEE